MVKGFHLPKFAKMRAHATTRRCKRMMLEDVREVPKSKEGITSPGRACSGFGMAAVFTSHTPQSFDSVQMGVSLFCTFSTFTCFADEK